MMAAATVVYEGAIPDFTKRTPEESELRWECCNKLKLELSEAVSELTSAKEIIRILKRRFRHGQVIRAQCFDSE